jgi:hypothetical protein
MFRQTVISVWIIAMCVSGAVFAQPFQDTTIVPLTVDRGFTLPVQLTEKLRFEENGSVYATVIEPVYAFDREVIPSGTELEGKIIAFQKAGRWKRISTMLSGDFTPPREPQIIFDTLILPSGDRIPIQASVVPGSDKGKVVGSDDNHQPKKGLTTFLASTGKGPAKQRLQNLLWGLAPVHPQYLPAGTHLNAVLMAPMDFGVAVFRTSALDKLGSAIPAGSAVAIRLITPLDSRTTPPGAPVEGLLTRPLFSPEHRLILPVGSVIRGQVTKVKAAHALHHNGQLDFSFTSIEPPDLLPSVALHAQEVDGYVLTANVTHDMEDLVITKEGAARIVESRKRFIGPAWSAIKVDRALSANADSFGKALLGAYGGKFLKEITGTDSGSGFGLPASVSAAMIPHVAIGLGVYGAARSVYSNFLGRGHDIILPENTVMEVHLEPERNYR